VIKIISGLAPGAFNLPQPKAEEVMPPIVDVVEPTPEPVITEPEPTPEPVVIHEGEQHS
jgi:hypothetical protein